MPWIKKGTLGWHTSRKWQRRKLQNEKNTTKQRLATLAQHCPRRTEMLHQRDPIKSDLLPKLAETDADHNCKNWWNIYVTRQVWRLQRLLRYHAAAFFAKHREVDIALVSAPPNHKWNFAEESILLPALLDLQREPMQRPAHQTCAFAAQVLTGQSLCKHFPQKVG